MMPRSVTKTGHEILGKLNFPQKPQKTSREHQLKSTERQNREIEESNFPLSNKNLGKINFLYIQIKKGTTQTQKLN